MPTVIISNNTTGTFVGDYGSVSDTRLKENQPTTNLSTATSSEATSWNVGDRSHALIRFDGITSAPAGTVSNAVIGVYVTFTSGGSNNISMHELLRDAVMSQATWNIYSTGNNWQTAGALGALDISSAIVTVLASTSTGLYVTFSGAALDALVQDWLDGTNTVRSVYLQQANDTSYGSDAFVFRTSEGTDGQRPYLQYDYTAGAGSQTLTPSLFTNTNTFYSPAVTTGAVNLTPALFTNSNTFYGVTVNSTYNLAPTLFTNTNTFFSATVSASYNIAPNLFTNTNTFYSPTVALASGPQTLTPSLFVNSNTFYSPVVTAGGVTLTPNVFNNTNTFYGATVNSTYTVNAPLFVNTNTFYSPTVTVGAVTLQPSLFVNTNTFYSPTVANANVVLFPNVFVNENTFYSPTVTGGVRSQNGFVISDGFYFVNGKRIDVLPKDNRKTRRLKKAIKEVKQEQQEIKQLIAKAPKDQDKGKLELHSRMLDLRVKESEAVLNNALVQLAKTAFNAKQAYEAKKTNKANKAKQLKEAEQLRIAEAQRLEDEQRQYEALQAEMAELEALQRQAQAKAQEEEDIIFIMTMLAA